MRSIDRQSPEPFYLQLVRLMEEDIDSGKYTVGDRLPAEMELCRNFDLARSTVRETLRSLQEKGRIKMVPRRGAFVVDPRQTGWSLQVADGFFEAEVDHHRRNVQTEVVEAGLAPLPAAAAEALGLPCDAMGYRLKRLRYLDGELALLSINYMVPEVEGALAGSGVLTGEASLNRTLGEAGFSVFGARRSVEARAATAELAARLEVPVDAPLLLVTSVSWGRDGTPFDYYTSWVRSDVVQVTIEARAPTD
jgi:GntR family transcriptional regulator